MVTHSNGAVVPAHTPAVATAKANFQHAGGNIVSSFGVAPAVGHMVTHSNGAVVPADTPAIATAKANFAHVGGNINPKVASAPVPSKKIYSGPMAVPGPMVTHSNGAVVPADTPAIVTARANFHQAGGKIKPAKAAFHHTGGHINPMVGMVPAHSKKVYSGPKAVPGPMVTHPNGAVVPKDTPAIATAKANFHQAGGNIKHSVAVPVAPGAYAGA